MATMTHVVGVDPGLVHTGVVSLLFRPDDKSITRCFFVVDGPDADAVQFWVGATHRFVQPTVFIEKYVPRQRLGTDERMVKAEAAFKQALPKAVLVRNTGAKQIVSQQVMQMLNVWSFGVTTHHQDLRSAARIMLYGMMKDPQLNELLADVIRDWLDGCSWKII